MGSEGQQQTDSRLCCQNISHNISYRSEKDVICTLLVVIWTTCNELCLQFLQGKRSDLSSNAICTSATGAHCLCPASVIQVSARLLLLLWPSGQQRAPANSPKSGKKFHFRVNYPFNLGQTIPDMSFNCCTTHRRL